MKLTDLPKNFDYKREQLQKRCNQAGIQNYAINTDLTIRIVGTVQLNTLERANPPLEKVVVDSLQAGPGRETKSFEHFPEQIRYRLLIFNAHTLHNIHKYVKYVGREVNLTNNDVNDLTEVTKDVPKALLCLLLIKGNFEVICNNLTVSDILTKYTKGTRDINLCQEELIAAGFGAHATF